jgi:hypothetical protein
VGYESSSAPLSFSALYRALGVRVLRRTFPDGWGGGWPPLTDEEEPG